MSRDQAAEATTGRRIIYHGRVQGVGFRFTAAAIAKRFGVKGYVRNLADGTVELVTQGSGAGVAGFLKSLAAEFEGHIEREQAEPLSSAEVFAGFEIRR
jgi:acylphosphatase